MGSFNLQLVLIICESSIGAFLLTALCLIYLVITLCISFISCTCWVPTISVLNLAIFPLPHKPAAQKLKKIWSTSLWCSSRVIAPSRLPVELWCLSAAMLLKVFNLVFVKTLFGNKYYILWHWLICINFLYGICVSLIHGHTYYEHLVWP
jgi:hypothetical protein